ncbi:D-amino acid dehydrogenase [Telmatospirillum siberiense]|uniref:D-amino acid dehydrogenase n=1 Tax=Telmatospirillum siberiense TaxID=382514 RepID=A0A2N3PZN7_9PROT|nr:D-amino acid dehydrogenase [Telmatospirillum siberiense]PKU25858.1 amino acid dehydrogenase [Telmatospirillum siberiense]
MKVLVLGAGVVGVTSAWYLAKAGHEVVVVDRQPGAGLETSFANGGQISPCHAEPWANPSTPKTALKWMGREDAPLAFRWQRWDPWLWAWGARFLLNCTASRASINTDRTLRVAIYSRACLQSLRAETGIEYDQKTQGILHVYRDPQSFQHAVGAAEMMTGMGLERQVKSVEESLALEPALDAAHKELAGGIFTPGDESGDAHRFTQNLAALCAQKGVVFHYGTTILGLEMDGGRMVSVATDKGRLRADAFVMSLGSWSPKLARHVGLTLPIYPAKGYSATLPVTDPTKAPTIAITDDEHKLVFSRLGDRLRCAGTAELAGWNLNMSAVRASIVTTHSRALFPGAGDFDKAQIWCGLRPVTPDSVPILGRTRIDNLFLNTGHGTLGWTMSCGSGRVLADLISNRPPDIDMTGLGLDRFALS